MFLHTVFSTFVSVEILHHKINLHNEIIRHLKITWNGGIFSVSNSDTPGFSIPKRLQRYALRETFYGLRALNHHHSSSIEPSGLKGLSWAPLSRRFCDIPLNYFHKCTFRERAAKPKSRTWTGIGL